MSRKKNPATVANTPTTADAGFLQEREAAADSVWEERLVDGLRKFDDSFAVSEPDFLSLNMALERHRQGERRKMAKELALFLAIGLLIIAGSVVLYMNQPMILPVVQGAAVLLPALALLARPFRRADRSGKRVDGR